MTAFFFSNRNQALDVYFKGVYSYGNPTRKRCKPVLVVQHPFCQSFVLKINCDAG